MAVQKSKKSILKKKLKVFLQINVLVKKYFIPLNFSVKNIHYQLCKLKSIKLNLYLKNELNVNYLKYSIKLNINYIKLYNLYLIL